MNPILSRVFIILFLGATLFVRMWFESGLAGHYWVSLVTGGLCLLFLWALIKSGILRPGWFSWEKPRKSVS